MKRSYAVTLHASEGYYKEFLNDVRDPHGAICEKMEGDETIAFGVIHEVLYTDSGLQVYENKVQAITREDYEGWKANGTIVITKGASE